MVKGAIFDLDGTLIDSYSIIVRALKGGHSGIDIGDGTRLNAAKLIAELLAKFPQGAYYKDETGVITSCNLGAIVAGGIQNSVASIVEKEIKTNDYISEIMKKTSTNIINILGWEIDLSNIFGMDLSDATIFGVKLTELFSWNNVKTAGSNAWNGFRVILAAIPWWGYAIATGIVLWHIPKGYLFGIFPL